MERGRVLHLGLMDGDYPYIVPLHYGYEVREDAFLFYLHGAPEGHKLDCIRDDFHVFVELECDVEPISGGDIPCRYGAAYASVMGRGEAAIVADPAEKVRGLSLLMAHQTGREHSITEAMASGVAVIRVTVRDCTAKARRMPK